MSKILYFDCFSGASGDMILGALLDAGLSLEELRDALGSLALGDVTLHAELVSRSGIGATSFHVDDGGHQHQHVHEHDHTHSHDSHHDHYDEDDGHHHHRGLSEICTMVDESALSSAAKERAKRLFRRLAEVEADIHQMSVEDVHLHEVGAVDSIIDITGVVYGLERLGVDRIMSSPLNVGSGTVRCEHGVMPVPAPATARLIEGLPAYSKGPAVELLTPTGALILSDYVDEFGAMPAMRVRQIGYGAGDREFADHPNLLRVLVGDAESTESLQTVSVIECEIDDMNPQIFGVLMDKLYAAGALEVFYAPIQMKKNRPGTLITIIAAPERREGLSGIVFSETTTIGLRIRDAQRECLEREHVSVETPLGQVRFKVARRAGSPHVVNAAPEFDDCVRIAEEHRLPVKEVQAIVTKAYLDSGES